MYISREIEQELIVLLVEYPVVTITGPRQSGKTTLVKQVLKEFNYCNLENPEIRNLAINDPNAFLLKYPTPLIIDEIQRVPTLLSYIQIIVDEKLKNGLFVLTGSHQFSIKESISQSLAGRTALLTLLPLSISELTNSGINLTRDEYIFNGFLPRIYDQKQNPTKAYRNYLQTYIERDLQQIIQVKNLIRFENFLRLLAGRIGSPLNLTSISNDLGVSSTTLSDWLSVLEMSSIIFKLQPYTKNRLKRVIKSPKLYFTDVGLVSYLLGIERMEYIARDPLIGALFENMIIIEALKKRLNNGSDPNLYFYRDNNKNEIDLLFYKNRKIIPVEIKSAMTFNNRFIKGVNYYQKVDETAGKGIVIYGGEITYISDNYKLINYKETGNIFK